MPAGTSSQKASDDPSTVGSSSATRHRYGASTTAAYIPSSARVKPTVRSVSASRPTPGSSVQSPHDAGSALGGTSPFHSITRAASGTSESASSAPPAATRLTRSGGSTRKNAATGTSHRNDWRVITAAPIARQATAKAASEPSRAYAWTRSSAIP